MILLGPTRATPEAVARVRGEFHLDDPFLTQYRIWLQHALQGDFGRSIRSGQPVTAVIAERFPVTLLLAVYAFLLTAVVGIPAGLASGVRRGSTLDRSVTFTSLVGLSAPTFAVAVLLIYVFAVSLGWFPPFGAGEGFTDRIYHTTLPAVTLAVGSDRDRLAPDPCRDDGRRDPGLRHVRPRPRHRAGHSSGAATCCATPRCP